MFCTEPPWADGILIGFNCWRWHWKMRASITVMARSIIATPQPPVIWSTTVIWSAQHWGMGGRISKISVSFVRQIISVMRQKSPPTMTRMSWNQRKYRFSNWRRKKNTVSSTFLVIWARKANKSHILTQIRKTKDSTVREIYNRKALSSTASRQLGLFLAPVITHTSHTSAQPPYQLASLKFNNNKTKPIFRAQAPPPLIHRWLKILKPLYLISNPSAPLDMWLDI